MGLARRLTPRYFEPSRLPSQGGGQGGALYSMLFRCHDAQYHVIGLTHGLGTNAGEIVDAFVNIIVHNAFVLRHAFTLHSQQRR